MGSRFLGYMGSDHIVTYGRADSLRDQGCHTGDKSIDHNRNTKGSTADKYACHTCNVQTTDFCKDIDRILRVRLVFVDRFFDRGDLAVQTISICPVNLSKAGLCYNAETNNIEDRIRDWIVEMPDLGFLFPVFNDRSTDIHGLLYYSKNAEQLRSTFVDELFGCDTPLSAGGQRDSFNALVEETLGEDCAYDTVMNIHEKLNEWVEAQKDSPEPAVLTKPEVKRLFEECGVEEEKMETFDQCYEATAGENASLMVSNITNTRRTEIKTPDVVIHVDPDRAALIETQIIDGRKCIVIPMEGDVEINGIHVTGSFSEDNAEEI